MVIFLIIFVISTRHTHHWSVLIDCYKIIFDHQHHHHVSSTSLKSKKGRKMTFFGRFLDPQKRAQNRRFWLFLGSFWRHWKHTKKHVFFDHRCHHNVINVIKVALDTRFLQNWSIFKFWEKLKKNFWKLTGNYRKLLHNYWPGVQNPRPGTKN